MVSSELESIKAQDAVHAWLCNGSVFEAGDLDIKNYFLGVSTIKEQAGTNLLAVEALEQ